MILFLFVLGVQSQHNVSAISINSTAAGVTIAWTENGAPFTQSGLTIVSAGGTPLVIVAKTDEIFGNGFQ